MTNPKTRGGSEADRKDARRERQARELRENLLHPHESEQPFTRSLSGVAIPSGIARVTIRAHDKIHAYGGKAMTVRIPR